MYREDRGSAPSTSPMKIMDTNAERELMEKVSSLQREFAEIDYNHDTFIRKEELYRYLDRKSGKTFDRAIADEIFEHMDQDKNGNVTINEFIKVYIQAEEMLKRKIEAAKANRESYKRQQEECLRKAEEEKLNEKLTTYGIAINSIVHVTIMEFHGIKPVGLGGPANLYVEAALDDKQKVKTRVIQNGADLVLDEKITFDVVNPDSVLKFAVFENKTTEADSLMGMVSVPLNELKDQNTHDTALDLFDRNGVKATGQLHVKLQWIHSKAKYYTMVAQKWLDNYNKEEEELREYERYIQTLYDPFPGLKATQQVLRMETSQQAQAPITETDKKLLFLMNQAARTLANEQNPSEGFWSKVTIILCIAEIIMALFLSFRRVSFFDMLIPIFILFFLKHGVLKDRISLKIYSFILLGSIAIFDIVFLCIYSGNWTNIESYDVNAEGGSRKFVIVLSYLNIILKIILALLCYTLNIQLSKQRGLVPHVVTSGVNPKNPGLSPNRY